MMNSKLLLWLPLVAVVALPGCDLSDSSQTTFRCPSGPLGCIGVHNQWQCNSQQGVFESACPVGELCTGGACHAPACTLGLSVCSADGEIREYCDVDGIPGAERCPVFCFEGNCINPNCFTCQGDFAIPCKGDPPINCASKGLQCVGGSCVAESLSSAKPLACGAGCAAGSWCDLSGQTPTCKPMACSLPSWQGTPVLRVTKLRLLPAGEGCDLNGDGAADNGLAAALGAAIEDQNAALQGSLIDGQIGISLRPWSNSGPTAPSGVDWLVSGSHVAPGCQQTPLACVPSVSLSSLAVTSKQAICPALTELPLQTTQDAYLTYGPGNHLTMPFFSGAQLNLRAESALLQAMGWGPVQTLRLCGWFTAKSLQEGIAQSANRSQFGGRAKAFSKLQGLLPLDYDADGLGICSEGPRHSQACKTGVDCAPAVFSCDDADAVSFAYELDVSATVLGAIVAP